MGDGSFNQRNFDFSFFFLHVIIQTRIQSWFTGSVTAMWIASIYWWSKTVLWISAPFPGWKKGLVLKWVIRYSHNCPTENIQKWGTVPSSPSGGCLVPLGHQSGAGSHCRNHRRVPKGNGQLQLETLQNKFWFVRHICPKITCIITAQKEWYPNAKVPFSCYQRGFWRLWFACLLCLSISVKQ